MAGSGKTTFINSLNNYLNNECCIMNLDPAVYYLPYKPTIDIKQLHDFKDIMKKYKLGPNGAILTALNLYAANFDKQLTEIKELNKKYNLIDTPGQIEAFTWSASGEIFTKLLASLNKTVELKVFVVCIRLKKMRKS